MKAKKITNKADLEKAFSIRKKVFVEEQGVPLEVELDEYDSSAEHILVYYNDEPVGTGRLRIIDDNTGKLERICVLPSYRKFGVGRVVVETLEKIAKEKGIKKVKIHGQTRAEGFYKKLNYRTVSKTFMEDGIPHVLMLKELN